MPPSLQMLTDRLAELDHESAPLIMPSVADMIFQPAADSSLKGLRAQHKDQNERGVLAPLSGRRRNRSWQAFCP